MYSMILLILHHFEGYCQLVEFGSLSNCLMFTSLSFQRTFSTQYTTDIKERLRDHFMSVFYLAVSSDAAFLYFLLTARLQ